VTQAVTTILVDANNLFREGLRRILSTTVFRVAKVAAVIDEIPLQTLRGSRQLLFLVGAADDNATTAATVGRLKAQNPTARVVVLSDRCELDDALAVLRAGADGYLLKQISCDALIKALDLVMLGVTILPAFNRMAGELGETYCHDAPKLAAPPNATNVPPTRSTTVMSLEHAPRRLSDRETGILRCLMSGDSNKTIARQFDIAEATVKVHIKAILRKIGARNRTQAAVWAHNHLLEPANTAIEPAATVVHGPIAQGNGHRSNIVAGDIEVHG
jgi:two-component system, NarL family, nitrate/nitrite response regulator NarL